MLDVVCLPIFKTNYVWLLSCSETGETAAVDPGDALSVQEACRAQGRRVTQVLITHHHDDHVGGVEVLRRETGCRSVGAEADQARLPELDEKVGQGTTVRVGRSAATVIETPGHTLGHVSYWFADEGLLFSGDALFSLGCGRMFEGTPKMFWDSLSALRALPPETLVFPAHEYTVANARFALSIDPRNPALRERAAFAQAQEDAGQATLPTTLESEREANPFLRADDWRLAESLQMSGAPPEDVFAELRRRKDVF